MAEVIGAAGVRSGRMRLVRGAAIVIGLGCVWGLAELTLGTRLHMSGIPLAGQIMMPVGIWCALSAHRLCPKRGIVTATGLAAALVRVVGLGAVLPMPGLAILLEAMLMESALQLAGPRRAGYVLAGAAAALYPLLHAFVFKTLLFGLALAAVYGGMIKQARTTLRIEALSGPMALVVWMGISILIGAGAGWLVSVLDLACKNEKASTPSGDRPGP